jgi:pimeloyl-ACP methyl ester carboxylesterase
MIMERKLTRMSRWGLAIVLLVLLASCSGDASGNQKQQQDTTLARKKKMEQDFKRGYAPVNGLNMYYEIHGSGNTPLVLIHGGGSTIETNWSRLLPLFSKHRQVIAMELQVHGHTADRDQPTSFEQDADDVAALLNYLHIGKADLMGFSNGGSTAMQVAIRHPQLVRKAIIASAFYKREGLYPQFWEFMQKGTFADMPQAYKDAFLKAAPRPEQLVNMYEKDSGRMLAFKDWPDEMIRSIQSPALIMIGNEDVVMPEHAIQMARLMPHAQVCIFPGPHGKCIGEAFHWKKEDSTMVQGVAAMLEQFLDEPEMAAH